MWCRHCCIPYAALCVLTMFNLAFICLCVVLCSRPETPTHDRVTCVKAAPFRCVPVYTTHRSTSQLSPSLTVCVLCLRARLMRVAFNKTYCLLLLPVSRHQCFCSGFASPWLPLVFDHTVTCSQTRQYHPPICRCAHIRLLQLPGTKLITTLWYSSKPKAITCFPSNTSKCPCYTRE